MNAARMGWVFGTVLWFATAGGLSESWAADWLSGSESEFLDQAGPDRRPGHRSTRREEADGTAASRADGRSSDQSVRSVFRAATDGPPIPPIPAALRIHESAAKWFQSSHSQWRRSSERKIRLPAALQRVRHAKTWTGGFRRQNEGPARRGPQHAGSANVA
jgi:hypothetical protein